MASFGAMAVQILPTRPDVMDRKTGSFPFPSAATITGAITATGIEHAAFSPPLAERQLAEFVLGYGRANCKWAWRESWWCDIPGRIAWASYLGTRHKRI